MEENTNVFLGTEHVGKLMRGYAVPCIISLLVGALYNIVDQIFIANASYLGSYGNAANTVVFPLTVVALAIAVMIGDGCCAFVSISLGQNEVPKARRSVGNAVVMCLVSSIVLAALYLIFADNILAMFGGTVNAETYHHSQEYFFYITLGVPFYMFGQAMNPIIRADGNPKFAMISTLAGAAINIILDPIFIFSFGMGIRGAAIATVIGQVVSCTVGFVLNQWKNRELRLTHEGFCFDWKTVQNILVVGIPSTIMQAISSVCTTLMNMILAGFGDIYVNVLGVYFKLQSFVFMPVFGLGNGMVPIVGYNFGAQKKKRVYECIRVCLVYALVIMAVGALLFLTVPNLLMMPFDSSADKTLTAEGCVALRIICSNFLIAAVGITLSTVFQAVGRGTYSLIMSLCRQLIVLLPAAWALSLIGPNAIWWAFPIAEIVSLAICLLLYRKCDRELIAPLPEE